MWRSAILLGCLAAVAGQAYGEDAQSATICQLQTTPENYNHQLISVTGLLTRGFENFTFFDPACAAESDVWLEYGGTEASQTLFCCGSNVSGGRRSSITVEGIPIPLVNDTNFKRLRDLLKLRPNRTVHATVVGRFFTGSPEPFGGYGHFSCCSLFVIQQVLSVDQQNRKDIDYGTVWEPPPPKRNCSYEPLLPHDVSDVAIETQQSAENGQAPWAFADPRRAAQQYAQELLRLDASDVSEAKLSTTPGRALFEWKPKGQSRTYSLMLSKPYWLSFYARQPDRIAWTPLGAYALSC